MIDISGLDRVEVLRCLYNGTRAVGMGFLHDLGRDMTYAEAAVIWDGFGGVDKDVQFDYIRGRPIKVGIQGSSIVREDLYDRDTRPGACADIIMEIRTRPST